jgi:hypothetical protein
LTASLFGSTYTADQRLLSARIDHVVSERHRLSGRLGLLDRLQDSKDPSKVFLLTRRTLSRRLSICEWHAPQSNGTTPVAGEEETLAIVGPAHGGRDCATRQ